MKLLYIAVVSILVLSSNIAWAQTAITGCTTITHPGSYVLKNNITATYAELSPAWLNDACIVIAANFVTIDLSGYLITGPGPYAGNSGIAQDKRYRFGDVVENGAITGFAVGLSFAGNAHTIKDLNASGNGSLGIELEGTENSLKDVTASNNEYDGIFVQSYGNRFIGNTASGNQNVGIEISTCPNLLLENMAAYNRNGQIVDPGCIRQENSPAP